MQFFGRPYLPLLGSISLFCVGLPGVYAAEAAPDDDVDEIVVTAEFRESALEKTPTSVAVLTLEDQRTRTQHIEEVLGQIANVNFSKGASRARFVQIRGIGERGQFSEPLNSSVGLIIDGVDLSGIGTAATLFDVEQVEVFRGPQGALYGANALAGLINVVTAAPTEEFSTSVRADLGEYGASGFGVAFAGPLGETAGFRLSAQTFSDDGFMDNIFLGTDDTDNHDERSLRGKIVLNPSDDLSATFVAGYIDIDNGYDAFSLDNNRTTRSDTPGRDQQTTAFGSVKIEAGLNETTVLEASIGFASSDIDYGYDEDWTFVGFHPWEYSSTDRYLRDRETLTADVRLIGTTDSNLDWVAGIYTLQQDVSLDRQYTFAGPFSSGFDISRVAAYGELTAPLGDRVRLTAGLRAERHSSSYSDTNLVTFDPSDNLLGGRVVLEMDVTSESLVYGLVARGYKAGGFNTNGSLDLDLREFDPEKLLSVEVGWKAVLADGALRLRTAAFRMERDDAQADTSIVRVRADGSAEFIDYIDNAVEGVNQGVEAELTWFASERLTVAASVGLLDAEFDSYVNGSGDDLTGRDQAQAPSHQYFVSADYAFSASWSASLQIEGRDDYFFSNSHDLVADSYALWHAAIEFRAERWSVSAWGRNLTDEDYFVRGFVFGNDPRDFYATRGWTQLAEPRLVGLTARASF